MGSILNVPESLTRTRFFLFSRAFQQLDAPWVTKGDTTAKCWWSDLLPYTDCMDQAREHSQCTKAPYLMVASHLDGLHSSFSAWDTFYFSCSLFYILLFPLNRVTSIICCLPTFFPIRNMCWILVLVQLLKMLSHLPVLCFYLLAPF